MAGSGIRRSDLFAIRLRETIDGIRGPSRAEQLHLDLLTEVRAQRERAVIVQLLVTRPPYGIAHSLYFDLSSQSQCFPICPLRQHKLRLPNLAR